MEKLKIIMSGGGTGGHVFPAIAIANAIKEISPEVDILFVGAQGKIEMDKVPEAGYKIIGLEIQGFQRKFTYKNLIFFYKLIKSLRKSRKLLRSFKPHCAIGVGGYASGPVLRKAVKAGIKTLIQEQNSYPGITNRLLAGKVNRICVAYPDLEKYFPTQKIVLTGNPVRKEIVDLDVDKSEALNYFNILPGQKIILVLGGSGGAMSLKDSLLSNIEFITKQNNCVIVFQSGKRYFQEIRETFDIKEHANIRLRDFIPRMDYAYSIADVIISRAGAGTISELCLVGKPCIFVPSPHVAEDHQTKNVLSLVDKNAAMLVKDSEAKEKLFSQAISLLDDEKKMAELSANIKKLAIPDSAQRIAKEVMELINNNTKK